MHYKRFFPHLIAVFLFAMITIIHFNPLFTGKVINQYDISQFKGMSKEISDFRKTNHSEPLWTNSMFCGMPAYQVSTLYPGNKLSFMDDLFHLFLPHPSGYMFMYFLGFYILLLCLGVNPWLALVGSLAYGLSSYFYIIIEVGHNSKANAIGYLAPALGGIILLMRKKYWLGFAITILFMALELNTNHLQITYYGMMLFVLVFLAYFVKALKEKALKPYFTGIAFFIGATMISVLPNAGNLLCTYEYGNYTTRGKSELTMDANGKSNTSNATSGLDKDYAVQYSYGVSESFSFLIPNFKGGSSSDQISNHKSALEGINPQLKEMVGQFGAYYGPQEYVAGPVYIGAIVLLLAFLGLFIIDHPIKWALFVATILSVMLAWGKNFMGLSSFFLDYVPAYNKFRAVSIINILAELTIPLLAILALDKVIRVIREKQTFAVQFFGKSLDLKKMLFLTLVVVGGFCLLCIMMPDMMNTFSNPGEASQIAGQFKQAGYPELEVNRVLPELMLNIEKARRAIFISDAWRSLVLILLSGVFLFIFLIRKMKAELLMTLLGILFIVDLWPVAFRYLNAKNFIPKSQSEGQAMTNADQEILKDTTLDYRVLNIAASPFQDAKTSYYHKSLGGYHGAKLKKYHELMDFHLFKEISVFNNGIGEAYASDSARKALYSELPVLNMLNAKYFICPTKQEPIVIRNTEANGPAWFVKDVQIVANADSEIIQLGKINTKTRCIIQQKNKGNLPVAADYTAKGSVRLSSCNPNHMIYNTETTEKQFVVFSEIYYPKGWTAFIDGVVTPYACVNYLLRGMEIPAGKHTIEFKFEPAIYKTGNTVAYIGSVLVLLCIAGGILLNFRFNTSTKFLKRKVNKIE